ncbi:Uncharacterised protein [Mycobacteroides abscessus subsp. bolletii]|nr:Uncharacterised protein [Mycobacteroides abscessus subsp. bolletii]
MANERITEDLVDAQLRSLGFYDDEEQIVVEKQQSVVQDIRKALSKASKTGKGKAAGYPRVHRDFARHPGHGRPCGVQG